VSEIKNSNFYIKLPLILAIAIAVGILIGATMAGSTSAKSKYLTGILKLKEVISHVEDDYVEEVDTDELVETAIKNMLEKLDPHSVYIPAEDLKLTKSELQGSFDGIGIEFSIIRDTIYVVAPLSGGPSEKAGLLSGDKIIEVEDESVAGIGITNRDVFQELRGPKGSVVNIKVIRGKKRHLLDFTIVRDQIPQHSVDVSYMVNDKIGYIKLSRFSANTYKEFKEALTDLKSQGMKKLILDLQRNPGGYMERAIEVADEFLSGDDLIVYTKSKKGKYNTEARAKKKGIFEEEPLIVLIDEGSASASEIVSGALQDNDRALIVGRRSFGKGLVQKPIALNDGSELRLTISRYYIPSGRSIQKPYNEEVDQYYYDLSERFSSGELFSMDSIQLNDSIEFYTSKGRVVYGGGGIVPDYFVPMDTSEITPYFNKLFTNNVIGEFTLKYYNKHKQELEAMRFEKYREDFELTDKMLEDLIELAKIAEVEYEKEQFNRSKELLKLNLKAQIARRVWENKGFYPIINQKNAAFQKALSLFDEAEKLAMR